ncbi:hypothetical protein FN846DRAFT_886146 [Sphaerosporella brunnea]|uniref:Uncharacterized protein n=1 Tax=Sphaerosporella brunnea TaxID=1250544 RepID=A0A5J5F9J0_9PEZI|nr:hypothetical protein FN846DRAFT_886146 [Sphaerosporella brunnea]
MSSNPLVKCAHGIVLFLSSSCRWLCCFSASSAVAAGTAPPVTLELATAAMIKLTDTLDMMWSVALTQKRWGTEGVISERAIPKFSDKAQAQHEPELLSFEPAQAQKITFRTGSITTLEPKARAGSAGVNTTGNYMTT